MITNKLKELEAARAKIASLEKEIAAEVQAELASLPAKYGFASASEFAQAVLSASGAPARAGKAAPAAKAAPVAKDAPVAKAASGKKRRKRAVITDATRASVKKMVAANKTGSEIAKALGISLPSVQNIKKALGLVKKR